MEKIYKARGGYRVEIRPEDSEYPSIIYIRRTFFGLFTLREDAIMISDIVAMDLVKSMYDIPFFEKTVILQTRAGRKYRIKKLRYKNASEIVERIQKLNRLHQKIHG